MKYAVFKFGKLSFWSSGELITPNIYEDKKTALLIAGLERKSNIPTSIVEVEDSFNPKWR